MMMVTMIMMMMMMVIMNDDGSNDYDGDNDDRFPKISFPFFEALK